jgi:ribosomal protein S12 methylthiotransferase
VRAESPGPVAPVGLPREPREPRGARSYWITTLGCPKNVVDSDKLAGRLAASGLHLATSPEEADLVVVNTCAFIEPAREESVEEILSLNDARRPGAKLAVTGCLAERNGPELARALPEIDVVAGFGEDLTALLGWDEVSTTEPSPVDVGRAPVTFRPRREIPRFDLLELPRPAASAPWAYVKVAEGCDRRCGFCAIPSFRGRQRSRRVESILQEVDSLGASEVVLVAQDLASFGRDRGGPRGAGIVELVAEVAARVDWVRLLYLYPSSLTDALIDAVVATGVPYFDLSLQHVSPPLLRRMRRVGSRRRFLERIERIRSAAPGAALRSSFILGYPGESEEDHDELLGFLSEADLDWAGFFTFSREAGTYADDLDESLFVPEALALERLAECAELQDQITSRRRRELVGCDLEVLVESAGRGRTYREAPEIDGVVRLASSRDEGVPGDRLETTRVSDAGASSDGPRGGFVRARCVDAEGPDLVGEVIE